MSNCQNLRDILATENLSSPPTSRRYADDWVEVVVGIGNDHVAYVTMTDEAQKELLATGGGD